MITKSELKEQSQQGLSLRVSYYETEIDGMLRKHVAERGLTGFVDFPMNRGSFTLPNDVRQELHDRYRCEGYEVNTVSSSEGETVLRIMVS